MNPRAPGGKAKGPRGKDEANGHITNGKGHPEENGMPTQEEDHGRTWDRNSWNRGPEEKGKGGEPEFNDGKNARFTKGKEGVDPKGKKGGKEGRLSTGSDDEREKGKGRTSTSPEPQMRTTPPREQAKDRRSPEPAPKGGKGDMSRADRADQALNRALDSLQVHQDGGRPAPTAPDRAPQPTPQAANQAPVPAAPPAPA